VQAVSSTVTEGGSSAFRFTRTGGGTGALTVNFSISGTAAAGSDYNAIAGNVTIPSGQTSAEVALTTINDAAAEPDETVVAQLTAGNGICGGQPEFEHDHHCR
jgi:hypothetical protein